jgi:hypothetical protein
MPKSVKAKKPSTTQAMWLRRIAISPMMKTYIGNKEAVFSLASGEGIPPYVAQALIRNGWVKGQKDGMFDDPQTYIALTPPRTVKPSIAAVLDAQELG